MGQRIKMRRDTTANWTAANPILADGEIGYDKTLKMKKMGDGVTAWNALAFVQTAWADVTGKPTIPAAQVNSDWNAASGLAQILNKPAIPADQVNSDWNAASGLAQILNKPAIPAAQVQSDWNAVSGLGVILNKPAGTFLTSASDIDGGVAAG